jgi:hypothetical protein
MERNMESIKGHHSLLIDATNLKERLCGYPHRLIDIGTGDGRFVQHVARHYPGYFAIGIDACRENLREISAKSLCNNTLYLIANAAVLPHELQGIATHITINFPWGSLLQGLLADKETLYPGIIALGAPETRLDIRLNGGALAESGWSLEDGTMQIGSLLRSSGFDTKPPVFMHTCELRQLPTTWAKRLAFGRDPRATLISGVRRG